MARRVLVTAALPYSNGTAHLGHAFEAVQTDVYVRARKMMGDDVVFIWADDTHGTPIQVRAKKEGRSPEEVIREAHDNYVRDYGDFGIGYDIFYTTHSDENRKHAAAIFAAMNAQGDIVERAVEQLYSAVDGMFLADRFIKGTCPYCKSPDQYGDSCEKCHRTYAATELIEPRSAISGAVPELRTSDHLFVPLARHEAFLRTWLRSPAEGGRTRLHPTVRNYVSGWVDKGLRDWDISREAPYFGFEIPGHPGKYFYVWFDAPIGYIAATDKYCQETGRDFDTYWKSTPDETEIVHVIGKDIVYFHTLFWPAMLNAAGYTVPTRVQVHGWLMVNGEKMSKTRGTFIQLRTYLEHLPADYLRYYFAAKLDAGQDDFDLSMEDFAGRVNGDLVNKAANLASRCVKFLEGRLDGRVRAATPEGERLLDEARQRLLEVPGHYREFEFSKALRIAIDIADSINLYVTEEAPWKQAPADPERAAAVLSVGVQASLLVAAILKPVLPGWAAKVERMLRRETPLDFQNALEPVPVGTVIGPYENLADRLDPKKLDAIIEASREDLAPATQLADAAKVHEKSAAKVAELAAEVTIDAFAAIDLRVALVVGCEPVEGADKLLRLELDLGPLGRRKVLSGIAKSYEPSQLLGKRVVVFANLAPRKMRFGTSEGMILAAGDDDARIVVLELADTALPGQRIS